MVRGHHRIENHFLKQEDAFAPNSVSGRLSVMSPLKVAEEPDTQCTEGLPLWSSYRPELRKLVVLEILLILTICMETYVFHLVSRC